MAERKQVWFLTGSQALYGEQTLLSPLVPAGPPSWRR